MMRPQRLPQDLCFLCACCIFWPFNLWMVTQWCQYESHACLASIFISMAMPLHHTTQLTRVTKRFLSEHLPGWAWLILRQATPALLSLLKHLPPLPEGSQRTGLAPERSKKCHEQLLRWSRQWQKLHSRLRLGLSATHLDKNQCPLGHWKPER